MNKILPYPRKIAIAVSLTAVLTTLSACGGGGSGSSDSPTPVDSGTDPSLSVELLTGIFLDSPITGLSFLTDSGHEGETGIEGGFSYEAGDSVTFSIGDLAFPLVVAQRAVTPLELFSAKDINDRRVVNFLRIVQSLDDDGNIEERIQLRGDAADIINQSGLTLEDFDQGILEFATDHKVTALLSAAALGELVSDTGAVAHFSQTMKTSDEIDIDNDGAGNNSDPDDDNDGVPDQWDEYPYDAERSGDFDLDGVDNIEDSDDDNDGFADGDDDLPFDPAEHEDTDGDGIGNNADEDDDNDGTPDIDDDAPLDPNVAGDADGDGIDNTVDPDDDGDGVVDSRDAFPLDPAETADFDADGVGDNADLDDDNDSVPDTEDRIHIVGNKEVYFQEETIVLRARGFDPDFNPADPEDGWHIQFYTYDVENPNVYLSEYTAGGAYNASYDSVEHVWEMKYWAPRKPGEYRTELALYCSESPSVCEDVHGWDQVEQSVYFTSTCAEPPCSFELDKPRGSYVTNSTVYPRNSAFVQRANGELVAIVSEEYSYLARSTDGGKSWSEFSTVPEYIYGNPVLIENRFGKLMLLGHCDNGGACIYETSDGQEWLKTALTQATNFAGCDLVTCDWNLLYEESLIETADGTYVVSYSLAEEPQDSDYDIDVYVTSSIDLQSWTDPVKISTGTDWDFDSTLLQSSSGKYYAGYVSYSKNSLVIAESDNLLNWVEAHELNPYPHLHMMPRLREASGVPMFFFATYGELKYSYLRDAGSFSSPQVLTDSMPFGPDVQLLESGRLGIMYPMDLNNQRDVFYEDLQLPAMAN
ncbi:sialidase family protein [Microbulbifer aggregans]|uniref:sialidase family protein n=1 Tax=Microbulbifer aggregans TaxID=1769779 RepID=UPI001CFD0B36|nr:sialidase family protein [Microbulbifer aggregans]